MRPVSFRRRCAAACVPQETVGTVNNNLVASCFGLMDALLKTFERGEGQEPLTPEERLAQVAMLPSLMLFSILWSIGASCDKAGRAVFDEWFRTQVLESKVSELRPPASERRCRGGPPAWRDSRPSRRRHVDRHDCVTRVCPTCWYGTCAPHAPLI